MMQSRPVKPRAAGAWYWQNRSTGRDRLEPGRPGHGPHAGIRLRPGSGGGRGGNLSASAPNVRAGSATSVNIFLRRASHAERCTRVRLQQMLLEPELPKRWKRTHLVATLLSLNRIMPNKTKASRRGKWSAGRR